MGQGLNDHPPPEPICRRMANSMDVDRRVWTACSQRSHGVECLISYGVFPRFNVQRQELAVLLRFHLVPDISLVAIPPQPNDLLDGVRGIGHTLMIPAIAPPDNRDVRESMARRSTYRSGRRT